MKIIKKYLLYIFNKLSCRIVSIVSLKPLLDVVSNVDKVFSVVFNKLLVALAVETFVKDEPNVVVVLDNRRVIAIVWVDIFAVVKVVKIDEYISTTLPNKTDY